MTVNVKTSGSQTATLSTEHDLATVTDPGVYTINVDLGAMLAADITTIRIYGKVRSSDTERLMQAPATFGPIPPTEKFAFSVPVVSPHHMRVTLTQTAGTGRAYPWAIYATA